MGSTPLRVGEIVGGKFRIEREIGHGGMGVVYSAIHIHLEQRVALKFLSDDAVSQPDLVERFWREARTAVKIQSIHAARVLDIAQLDNKSPYIVMEYLEGDNLDTIVGRKGPLAIADAIRYVLQVCEALAEMHVQGMVHRDIKPANLFLANRSDGKRIVKLLDFGITKAAPAWTKTNDALTNTTAVIGSPRYMSPEQLRNARDVDARADIWALGVTLFELLGGASPFARGTMPEVCASILKEEPKSLVALRPEVPLELQAVILRCLEKEADARYRNVGELALALRPFGPRGILDISIERIVGTLDASATEPEPEQAAPPPPQPPPPPPDIGRAPTAFQAITVDSVSDLEKYYFDRLGSAEQIPRVSMSRADITSLVLDHRAGFLLSLVDGRLTIDELLDVCGMQRLEALRCLCELLDHGAVVLAPPAPPPVSRSRAR